MEGLSRGFYGICIKTTIYAQLTRYANFLNNIESKIINMLKEIVTIIYIFDFYNNAICIGCR